MIPWSFLQYGLYAILALIAGAIVAGRAPPVLTRATEVLETRVAVVLLGLLGGAFYWYMWGSLNEVPFVHDEAGYLLQAQIYARGMWTAPAPPLPHFFEQFHVFVTPVLAPKYPPGHPILLVPGVWLGLPGIMPVVLNGLTGALVFALVRRLSNPWVGLLAWFLWLVTPASLVFRQAYFSEMSTGFLMLLAWWYLLEWRDSATTGSLVIVSAAVGWGAITRPLTALAFGLPIIIYVLWQGWRRGKWKQLAVGAAVGAAILMLQPWQNLEVTGDWSLTPIRRYSEVYFPFDWMGFDTRDTAPLRELPLDMRQLGGESVRVHNAHTVEALPTILRDRVKWILHTTWGGWWVALAPLAAIALIGLSVQGWFALGTFVLLVVGYLLFAHPAEWVLYYMEAQEIVVMITAVGIWNFSQWVVRLQRRKSAIPAREAIVRGGIAVCAFMLVVAPFKTKFIGGVRDPVRALRQQQSAFRTMLAELPQPSVVFVRYSASHDIQASLITNAPDLDKAHAWTVYDRGAENLDLLAEARGRTPYLFEEHTGILHLMDPTTGDILDAGDESPSPSGGP